MNSWQKVEKRKEENLRISGEQIMRTAHNATVKKKMLRGIKQLLASAFISMATLSTAYAFDIDGKVYLDYDNTASKTEMPLMGLKVELYDSNQKLLSSVTTNQDGSYKLDAPLLGTYKVVAKTAEGETIDRSVQLIVNTGASAQNLFIKGQGGDINLAIKDGKGTGAMNIPVRLIHTASKRQTIFVSNNSGIVELKNTLKGHQYDMVVNTEDFIADSSNKIKYALWDATLPDSKNAYVDKISFNMAGKNQKGVFNVKPRNEWGVDGVVAIDQNADGIYTVNSDTGAIDMNVELYYPGTTTKVLGTKTITTTDNGRYHFRNLAVAKYDIKVTNVKAPYIALSKLEQNVTITDANGQTSGPNFLLNIDPNDTTLAGISGLVFALTSERFPEDGPDGGKKNGNTLFKTGDKPLVTPVHLYQHDGNSWSLIAKQTTNKEGAYKFRGLRANKDYKIVLEESGIDTNQFFFIGDTDGKSTSTSSESKSTHKGKVKLSNGTQDKIAPKEIIITNLNGGTKSNQNFWYSKIGPSLLGVESSLQSVDNKGSWGGEVNGMSAISTGPYINVAFFEEDGVTPATKIDGTRLYAKYLKGPDDYSRAQRARVNSDHGGIYTYKIIGYDSNYLDIQGVTQEYRVRSVANNASATERLGGFSVVYFRGKTPNSISGYVYLNNSHVGTTGNFDPKQDVPIRYNRVVLQHKQVSTGKWENDDIAYMGTDKDGRYNFTKLPDGEYRVVIQPIFGSGSNADINDIVLERNDQNDIITKNTASIVVKVKGGQNYTKDTNFWYKLKQQDYVVKGTVYLDTYRGDGKLTVGGTADAFDKPLFDATVLLCRDNNDCTSRSGKSVLASQKTDKTGRYEFTGKDGLTKGKDFIIKVVRSDTEAVTDPKQGLAQLQTVRFDKIDLPIIHNFLMQGKGKEIRFIPINDLDGNEKFEGNGSKEQGYGIFQVQYWNGSAYQEWLTAGDFYNNLVLDRLPKGKYRIIHNQDNTNYSYIDIADKDPVTDIGVFDIEVLADGTLANNVKPRQYIMQVSKASKGITGNLYLDITGSGKKEDAVLLTSQELSKYNKDNLRVEGIFSPRVYKGYYEGDVNTILNKPDFIDKTIKINGEFAYNQANSPRGTVYLTNMLLRLQGLDSNQFELVASGNQPKDEHLPDEVKKIEYLQVSPTLSDGASDQYWLVKLKNDTEISGRLYYDYDEDGNFNTSKNDVPIVGVTVELYRNGELYNQVKTDKSGIYSFKNLFNDTYTIKVTEQGLDVKTYELKSALDTVPNIKITSQTPKIKGGNLDFIYKKNGDAAIAGYVMVDINNNGKTDISFDKTGDLAVTKVKVKLFKKVNNTLVKYLEADTNENGYYSFSGIDLNTDYVVEVVPPSNYGVISNANLKPSKTLETISFGDIGRTIQNQSFLLAGSSNSSPSAGIASNQALNSGIAGKTIIEGTSPELPIDNVLIGLVTSNGTEIARQYTNSKGEYHFYNLPSGKYSINVVTSPDGYSLVKNSKGTTQPINTLSNIEITNTGVSGNSFYYKEASVDGIQGKIYVDFADNNTDFNKLNAFAYLLDNKAALTVELHEGLDGNGKLLMTQKTVDGKYQFSNLMFGNSANYSVVLKLDTNADYEFKQSSAGKDAKHIVIPVAKLPKKGSPDNNYLLVGKQKIGGYVWVDENGSKDRQDDEGLNGIKVTLNYQAPGTTDYVELKKVDTKTVNGKKGNYQFEKLPKGGNYQIKVSTPDGMQLIANTVIKDNKDTYEFPSLDGDKLTNSTAYKYNGTIKGHVSIDVDNSQTKTAVDGNLAGLKLSLKSSDGKLTREAITNSDGNFAVDNLSFGDWVITADNSQSVTGYQLSYTQTGNKAVAVTSKDLSLTVNLSKQNPAVNDVEIGYRGSAVIKGYVVIDANNDGKYSEKEDIAFGALSTPITPKLVLTSTKSGFVEQAIKVDAKTGLFEVKDLSQHDYVLKIDDKALESSGYKLVFSPNSTTVTNQVTFSVNGPKDTRFSAGDVAKQQAFGFKAENALKGTIYKDYSGQGTHQPYHVGTLSGVKVVATNSNGLTLEVESDSKGEYEITNIAAGSWTIRVEAPSNSGYDFSYVAQKVGGAITSITGNGAVVNIAQVSSANKITKVDFGLKGQASIEGQVVIDVNANDGAVINAQDIGIDKLFADYTVGLYVDNNLVKEVKAVSTGSTETELGNYRFENLVSGVDYQVKVSRPVTDYVSSFMLTDSKHKVTVDQTDSEMSETYQFAGATDKATGVSFAWKGTTSIKGKVYLDGDDDGIYNASYDSSVNAALTVKLSNINNPILQTTQTIAAGEMAYEITGLIPGKWQIEVEGVPSTLRASFDPDDAHHDSKGQLMLPKTANMATVEITGNLTDKDFGYIHGGIIEGKLVEDREGKGLSSLSALTGLSGADVYLLDNTQKHLMNKENKPLSFMTNSDGKFMFRNLEINADSKYSIRLLFGEYHDGVVGSDKTNPLYEKVPYFEQYIDSNGKVVKHDLIDLATPPASIVYNGSGGMQTLPIKLNDGSSTFSATSNDIVLGYRAHNADVTVIKTALKDNVVVGDIVPYTIKVINNSSHKSRIKIKDILPSGFKFVKGSSRLNGKKVA
uniref:SdrD B-like domain-containing protein n=1 Tax=Gilliamella sp. G0441 TaxID=3384760 RepID=UPI003D3497BF